MSLSCLSALCWWVRCSCPLLPAISSCGRGLLVCACVGLAGGLVWFGCFFYFPLFVGVVWSLWRPSAVCFLGVVVLASAAAAALHQCAVYLGAVHFTKSTQNKCHCHWCFLDICLGSSSYIGCLRLIFRGSVGESSAISHVFFSAQPPLSQDQKGFKSLRQSWELLGLRERNTLVGRPSRGWTFFDVSRMTQLEH